MLVLVSSGEVVNPMVPMVQMVLVFVRDVEVLAEMLQLDQFQVAAQQRLSQLRLLTMSFQAGD
ncbi:hypothetical protein GGI21_001590 [Coemansia aciculifera]|nr:hypothetical protein GGI21_001590 [Coemansia aciculifera]